MDRFDSAESVMNDDVAALRLIDSIISNMEAEASISLGLEVEDATFEASIKERVALVKKIADMLEGATAIRVMRDVLAVWCDIGAAIDDHLNPDGSSKAVNAFADKLDGGHYSEEYDQYGWDD